MGQVLRAADALDPTLLFHGQYHKRYSGLHGTTRIEGLANDEQSSRHGESWLVLELPTLSIVTA
jgi:hypothetical protein